MRKKNKMQRLRAWILSCILLLISGFCQSDPVSILSGNVVAAAAGETAQEMPLVYPCGFPVGIYMNTLGIMVIRTTQITSDSMQAISPCEGSLLPGDYILAVNGCELQKKEALTEMIENSNGQPVLLRVLRDTSVIELSIQPVRDANGHYRLGIWVKDDVQGIGTLTYITQDGKFGALGHPINDSDTGQSVKIRTGGLYQSQIHSIIKGSHGTPGSLSGVICYDKSTFLGNIYQNNSNGIYGNISKSLQARIMQQSPVPAAAKESVVCGPAKLRCMIQSGISEYDAEIIQTDVTGKNGGLVIRITDPRLLNTTGGIIQGMSGSPIIQDGKLVGAVTHVLVNDPTRGYGIFIENMLDAAG